MSEALVSAGLGLPIPRTYKCGSSTALDERPAQREGSREGGEDENYYYMPSVGMVSDNGVTQWTPMQSTQCTHGVHSW